MRFAGLRLLVVLALLGPACAGGEAGDSGPTTTASVDQRLSDQLLLSSSDLPDGFKDDLREARTAEFHDRRQECLRKLGAAPCCRTGSMSTRATFPVSMWGPDDRTTKAVVPEGQERG